MFTFFSERKNDWETYFSKQHLKLLILVLKIKLQLNKTEQCLGEMLLGEIY